MKVTEATSLRRRSGQRKGANTCMVRIVATFGGKEPSGRTRPVVATWRRRSMGRNGQCANSWTAIFSRVSQTTIAVSMVQIIGYRRLIPNLSVVRFTSRGLATLSNPRVSVRTERCVQRLLREDGGRDSVYSRR